MLTPSIAPSALAANPPRLRELYSRGQGVSFGPLKLQKGKMVVGSKALSLGAIADMGIKNGVLLVKEHGKKWPFLKTPAAKVTNINAFLALATGTVTQS